MGIRIRAATLLDIPAITKIYGHHVRTGTGSFEIDPPDEAEMTTRFEKVQKQGWPYLVAVDVVDEVQGFAYAAQFRDRPAYAKTVEDSVYVSPSAQTRGIGRSLLTALIDEISKRGGRQIIAVIGDSENKASIGLHKACDFRHVGTYDQAGEKFGRLLDVVLMQRSS
jgi:L-amino acid N-acyltransferase YncA